MEKVDQKIFENFKALIDVKYGKTSEELAEEIIEITSLKVDIPGLTERKIRVNIRKD